MENIDAQIKKLHDVHSKISRKYSANNTDFSLIKLYQRRDNYSIFTIFYTDGHVYETCRAEAPSDNEDDAMDTVHLRYDFQKGVFENLLPDGPRSVYDDIPEIVEGFDEFGNRIEYYGDKLVYKYNGEGEVLECSSWSEKNETWIRKLYYYSDNQTKIVFANSDNQLLLFLFLKYNDDVEVERFIYDSKLQLKLRVRREFDERNGCFSLISYLPNGTTAWRMVNHGTIFDDDVKCCFYDKNDTLVYKEIEIVDDELGSITAFFLHEKFVGKWDEGLRCHNQYSIDDFVNISCFGYDESRWLSPYPEYGWWE